MDTTLTWYFLSLARDKKYQVNVVSTMLGRAKKHPNKTADMDEAILVFEKWMLNYKKTKAN